MKGLKLAFNAQIKKLSENTSNGTCIYMEATGIGKEKPITEGQFRANFQLQRSYSMSQVTFSQWSHV